MVTRSATKSAATRAIRKNCTHHWQIVSPEEQYSRGTCTKCGMRKKFLNYGEELRLPFGRRKSF